MAMAVFTLFATSASTETPNGTIVGITCCPRLPVPKVTPKIVPLSKTTDDSCHYTNKVDTPVCKTTRVRDVCRGDEQRAASDDPTVRASAKTRALIFVGWPPGQALWEERLHTPSPPGSITQSEVIVGHVNMYP